MKNIYQKNLYRLGVGLTIITALDLILGLAMVVMVGRVEVLSVSAFSETATVSMIVKDALGFVAGLLSLRASKKSRWQRNIFIAECVLGALIIPATLMAAQRDFDSLIDIPVTMICIIIFTLSELGHGEKEWRRVQTRQHWSLDIKPGSMEAWFNALVVGPHMELNENISAAVDRFLVTKKEQGPLDIVALGMGDVSPAVQETMRDIFAAHYSDEEKRVHHYLEGLYRRSVMLIITSLIVLSVWVRMGMYHNSTVIAMLLSNFAGFSLWQACGYHFDRSEGYAELMRAMIARNAKITFM